MPYLSGRAVLGDAAPTYDPGATGAENAATVKAVQDAAAGGSEYAKDWLAANATNEFSRATQAGEVPDYITDPADQQKFADLMTTINTKGFTTLSPEDQAAFNWLRTTGSSGDPGLTGDAPIGGKITGSYAWDPNTMTGDLPPGADRIAKDMVTPHSGDTTPYTPPPAERAINFTNGRYVYADDGTPVPATELARLGLSVTSSSSPPAPTNSSGGGSSSSSSGGGLSRGPSDMVRDSMTTPPPAIAPDDETAAPESSRTKTLLIAGGVGLGVLGLMAALSHKRR